MAHEEVVALVPSSQLLVCALWLAAWLLACAVWLASRRVASLGVWAAGE